MKRSIFMTACAAAVFCFPAFSQNVSARFEPCSILSATVSSEGKGHRAADAADGKESTWWAAAKGKTAGEWILVDFIHAEKVAALEITGGARGLDINKKPIYAQVGRIRKGIIELSNGVKTPFELEDSPSLQRILLPQADVRWVKITVVSVYPGSVRSEPCIAEISVLKVVPIYTL